MKRSTLAVSLVLLAECPADEMDGDSPVKRWTTIDGRLLAVKTPGWLRSLTLHHQRYQSRDSSKLPKLNGTDGDGEDGPGEADEAENNNNEAVTRRSTGGQRFAKLSRIALPPLAGHEARPAAHSALGASGSWLLPIIPSVQRREAYKQIREHRHKQFSAQTGRLPPIPGSSSPTGPSLSAPLPSNKGLMELCGSSPAKAREERTETAVVTPLVALHQRRRGEMKQEENEKLARIAPGAWDVTGEKSDAHLRHGSSAGNGDEAGAAAFGHQVASDPLPALSCSSRSAGSAGPPVGRRASPEQATPVLAPESRDPAPNQRTDPVRAPASAVPPATAARSNKQRRPPAVRWTIEWTDDHRTSPEPLSPVETEPEADAEPPVMASPSANRRVDRPFRSAGRVRRSPPPTSSDSPPSFEARRSSSPPVPAVLARQRRAQTAHPSLSVERSDSDTPAPETDERDEIIDDIQLHDLQLNSSSPEDGESIRREFGDGTAVIRDDDDDEADNRESVVNSPSNNLQPVGNGDGPSRSSSVEHLKKLLNNNQLDEAEDPQQVPASSPTFRRAPSEHLLYREENCLPNAVQNPDDRPAFVKSSASSRFVDYAMDFDDEDEIFGARQFKSSQERMLTEEEYEDDFETASRCYPTANSTTTSPSKSAVRLGTKSRSLASFAGRASPDDSSRRQRSLPIRRLDSSSPNERASNGVKKSALMASCRKPAAVLASSAAVRTRSPPVTNLRAPPDTLDPRLGLQMALKGINSPEWEDKLEGMRRLNELLSGYSESLAHETHTIALALLVEVKNLRSQVSRAAIQSLGKMFQHCGKHMEQDLDRSVTLLLNKTSDTNRFIRDDAHAALVNVVEYVSAPKAIVAIAAEGLTHKNSTVRAEAARLLAAIVVKLGPAKTLCGAKDVTERILPAAAHFVQDGSLEARGQAKIMFSVMIKDPVFDKALVKYLSPAVVRNIQRTLDVLRKNPQQF